MKRNKISELIKERVLILDGAMGTMIQQYGLNEEDYRGNMFKDIPFMQKGNNDLLSLTRPDVIRDIHRKYLEAGADIIETNTFSSQRISMEDYHLEDYCRDLNLEACKLARELADEYSFRTPDKPRFVAGSVGPTNKTCSMSPDVNDPAMRDLTYDRLVEAYQEQMTVLLEGGVDAFLIETIFDTLNAKAALYAAQNAMATIGRSVPIMLSVTISDKSGRMLSGQTLEAFLVSVSYAPIFSVGLNCSFGASDMRPFLSELSKKSPYYVSAYPNAGLPNSMGMYDQTPDMMAKEIKTFVDEGLVNIIGGCCGTTDDYIKRYNELIINADGSWKKPRVPVLPPNCLQLSGLEVLEVKPENNFLNIGERCNVAGSRKFLRLIKEKKYDEALEIARKQVNDGAQVLDINMDDGLLDSKHEMINFLNLIASEPDIARVPLMIDSSRWDVVVAGLKCVQGKCIVNSISLKEGEEVFLQHAREIKKMGAAVVVMAFDENGQADTYQRKIEICQRAYDLLVEKVGMNPNDIIFDPNVLAIATGMTEHDHYAVDFIRATSWIRENLPGAHVSGGISNLSFAFRGNNYIREAMHAVFLYHAIQNGLTMGIVNPSSSLSYDDIPAEILNLIEHVVLNRCPQKTDVLIALADEMKNNAVCGKEDSKKMAWRKGTSVEERLSYALIKGIEEYLEVDLRESLTLYPRAVDVIEGPLMDAMNKVGSLFGEGKMFLPQVVKTARTMKKAVEILQPWIEVERKEGGTYAGRILLATVKGDVHDIGKNIVAVVMACNNYEIIDLGVMCPAEVIAHRAIEEHVDLIGLSGLITPSLSEMVHVAETLNNAGVNVPLMIGGATTSLLHTALRIAPVYKGPVVWLKDASQNAPVASLLLNKNLRAEFIKKTYEEYSKLQVCNKVKNSEIVPLEKARRNKLDLFSS